MVTVEQLRAACARYTNPITIVPVAIVLPRGRGIATFEGGDAERANLRYITDWSSRSDWVLRAERKASDEGQVDAEEIATWLAGLDGEREVTITCGGVPFPIDAIRVGRDGCGKVVLLDMAPD